MKGEGNKENPEPPTDKSPESSPEKAETPGEVKIETLEDLETGKTEEAVKKQILLGEDKSDSNPKTTDSEAVASLPASKSTSMGSRQSSKAPLTNSTSMPGAFAISNPLSDDPIAASLRESQSSYTGESSSVPAANVTLQSQTTTGTTLTSNAFSSTHGDISAEPISVAVADPIEDSNSEGTSNQSGGNSGKEEHQRKVRVIASVAIAVLVALVVVLSIVLVSQGKDTDSSIPTDNEDEEIPSVDYDALLQRREDMIEFLGGLTDPDAFNPDHPKASADRIAALRWIVEEDAKGLEIPESNENTNDPEVFKLLERYVLALFYFSTKGDEWTKDYNFLSVFDVCKWSSAYGDENFFDPESGVEVVGVACDEDGRANTIRIFWNNLSGTIPDEISVFSNTLTQFLVGGGSITGTIPSVFGKFTQLNNIGLNDHCFTGTIPEELNQLPSLQVVTYYHNNNQLSGSLEEFCDSPEAYRKGVVTVISDSDIECSCCTLCHPNQFECDDQINNITWQSSNTWDISAYDSQRNVIQFTKECVNNVQRQWIADECPCTINQLTEPGQFAGMCDNCTSPDALPSYGN